MKIGIMQPYFFPYLGHFALIDAVDKWVVFDEFDELNDRFSLHSRSEMIFLFGFG